MREVVHTSSRHANSASTWIEQKWQTNGRECVRNAGANFSRVISSESEFVRANTKFSPSRCHRFGNWMRRETWNVSSADGSGTFIPCLQFYFSFRFAHVTSKYCRWAVFLGCSSPPARRPLLWMENAISFEREMRNEKFLQDNARDADLNRWKYVEFCGTACYVRGSLALSHR